VKFALMQQRLYPKDSRFLMRTMRASTPSELMLVWAGYMEPPGKHGGPVMSFGEHTLSEESRGVDLLAALGLPQSSPPRATAG
jgi:hypothetical protein